MRDAVRMSLNRWRGHGARGAAVSLQMMRLSMDDAGFRRKCAISRHEKLIIILLILDSHLDNVFADRVASARAHAH